MLNLKNKIYYKESWISKNDDYSYINNNDEFINYITDIASITKGKLGVDENIEDKLKRVRIFNRLLKESAGNPSTVFEFAPFVTKIKDSDIVKLFNQIRFGYIDELNEEKYLLTNLRNYYLIEDYVINNNTDFMFNSNEFLYTDKYKVIIAYLPYYIWMHLRTHRKLGFLIETARKPTMSEVYFSTDDLRYKDKPEMCRMRFGAICGWENDISGWDNMYNVRNSKNTQIDTKEIVSLIKNL